MKNKKGFTLVELLVVIAIIAILAAVVAPNAFKTIEKSKVTAITADYRAVKTATLVYYSDNGVWPVDGADEEGFITATQIDDPANPGTDIDMPTWNGPYMDVWRDNSPLGDGYLFVNGAAAAGTGVTNLTGIVPAGQEAAVYLRITNLAQAPFDKLEIDVGDTVVFADATDATWPKNVYLKIADK